MTPSEAPLLPSQSTDDSIDRIITPTASLTAVTEEPSITQSLMDNSASLLDNSVDTLQTVLQQPQHHHVIDPVPDFSASPPPTAVPVASEPAVNSSDAENVVDVSLLTPVKTRSAAEAENETPKFQTIAAQPTKPYQHVSRVVTPQTVVHQPQRRIDLKKLLNDSDEAVAKGSDRSLSSLVFDAATSNSPVRLDKRTVRPLSMTVTVGVAVCCARVTLVFLLVPRTVIGGVCERAQETS